MSRRSTERRAALALLCVFFAGGCDDSVDVPVTIRAGAGVTFLEAVALPGPCPEASALESAAVRDALGAEPFLAPGTLPIDEDAESVAAWGVSERCQVVAFACEPLAGTAPIVIEVGTIAAYDRCAGASCGSDGRCGPMMADGGPPGCGNGRIDDGEACDDGNETANDGCEPDCTITCESDSDCAMREEDVCDGSETCDLDSNTCVSMNPLDCDDGDACTDDSCNPFTGCVNDPEPFEMDDDGFIAEACGGNDCDDTDETVFPGAEELCDSIDNDCDGSVDEVAPYWYLDCDEDGFASDTSGARQNCDMPGPAGSCGWTSLRPEGDMNVDCDDSRDDISPDASYQTSPRPSGNYDWNCDEVETPQYPAGEPFFGSTGCGEFVPGVCVGDSWYVETSVTCGESATLNDCRSSGVPRTCRRVEEPTTVACR